MPPQAPISWRISLDASLQHALRALTLHSRPQVAHALWKRAEIVFTLPQLRAWASCEGTTSSRGELSDDNSKVSSEFASCLLDQFGIPQDLHLPQQEAQLALEEIRQRLKPLSDQWLGRGAGALAWLNKVNLQSQIPVDNQTTQREVIVEPLLPFHGGFHGWSPSRQSWQLEVLLHDVDPQLPEWLRLLNIVVTHRFQLDPAKPLDRARADLLTLAAGQWVESAEASEEALLRLGDWNAMPQPSLTTQQTDLEASIRFALWQTWPAQQSSDPEAVARWFDQSASLG